MIQYNARFKVKERIFSFFFVLKGGGGGGGRRAVLAHLFVAQHRLLIINFGLLSAEPRFPAKFELAALALKSSLES